MKLSSRNAIVTGGSQGLGRVIVESFLAEGANVVFCARNESDVHRVEAELTATLKPGQKLRGFVCDVSKPDSVADFFEKARGVLGQLCILVNNAGVYGPIGASEDVDFAQWQGAIEVNLYGVFHTCRAVMPMFKKQSYGKIINLSGGGATNPLPRFSAYAASKAAVVRLTETLAEELKEFNVDVNAVAPGALKTRLIDQVMEAGPDKAGAVFFARNKKWAEQGGTPLELGANLCVYLASAQSDGITGKLLSAQWDPWQNLEQFKADLVGTDIYTLRRIVPKDRGQTWGDK
jgi:NAD(P)-dependent dehydrogenase (short-subunit alcohol dehydrogenase family)